MTLSSEMALSREFILIRDTFVKLVGKDIEKRRESEDLSGQF